MHKIKSLLELLLPNFERAYNLHKNVSIDVYDSLEGVSLLPAVYRR